MRRPALVALAVIALVAAAMLVRRWMRTDEEILSDAVDEARSALVDHRKEDFLSFFADEVRYRAKGTRADLERDFDRWVEFRLGRVDVLSRGIEVLRSAEGDRATLRLTVDVGVSVQFRRTVEVDLEAAKGADGWRVDSFDWK